MRLTVLLLILPAIALLALVSQDAPGTRATHPCTYPWPYVVGDWSENGVVEINDAQILARSLIRMMVRDTCSPVDVDCNGRIGIADAQKIARYLVGLPYSQREPCPNIGEPMSESPGGSSPARAQTPTPTLTTSHRPPLASPYPSCFRSALGDWNGDSRVDATDTLQLLRAFAHLSTVPGPCRSTDVNCDDRDDIRDALALLKWLAGLPYERAAGRYCPCIGAAAGPILPPPPTPTPTPEKAVCGPR